MGSQPFCDVHSSWPGRRVRASGGHHHRANRLSLPATPLAPPLDTTLYLPLGSWLFREYYTTIRIFRLSSPTTKEQRHAAASSPRAFWAQISYPLEISFFERPTQVSLLLSLVALLSQHPSPYRHTRFFSSPHDNNAETDVISCEMDDTFGENRHQHSLLFLCLKQRHTYACFSSKERVSGATRRNPPIWRKYTWATRFTSHRPHAALSSSP